MKVVHFVHFARMDDMDRVDNVDADIGSLAHRPEMACFRRELFPG